jgi:predicted AlkP superfamily phosphohydrolase/phosphomutase
MIGLDAFDPDLARRLAESGDLPTLARLWGEGAQCRVVNPFGLFVGALWVSFASAQRVERHGFHCWEEIDVASYGKRMQYPRPERYDAFWKQIGDAGPRVAAVDIPHSRAPSSLNGVEIAEWGCHDRHFGLHAVPEPRARALEARFGPHPVLGIDAYAERHFSPDDFAFRAGEFRGADEDIALVRGMVAGVRTKGALLSSLLGEEPWDLFVGTFGEAHAIGHQQWHLHDPDHPRFDAALQAAMGGDPIVQVYREIDAVLGGLIERLPPDATMLVHLSHGMGPHHDGAHLLDEVLARLGRLAEGRPPRGGVPARARQALRPAVDRLGAWTRGLPIPPTVRRRMSDVARGTGPAGRANRLFFQQPNNSVYGGVRLNLVGREPLGRVRPEDAEPLLQSIEADLLALVNVETGRPAVVAITRAADHYERAGGDTIPDLFVEWDRSVPIERVSSPKIGTVHIAYEGWRTGDHFPDGLLLAFGPDFAAGRSMPPISVEDIGPSLAARLGVALRNVDGQPVAWLAGDGEPLVDEPPAQAYG